MWTRTGSTATVAPPRVERPRQARRRPRRSTSCCDHVAPAARSGTHETRAAAPAGRTVHRNGLRSLPTDPPPVGTPHEPPTHLTRPIDQLPERPHIYRKGDELNKLP